MRVVICPDSFKGSLDAAGAAEAIATGWRRARPGDELTLLPLADGGEGTADAMLRLVPGAVRVDVGDCTGPDGRPRPGWFVGLPDGSALVELAVTSGLPLLAAPDPLHASTRGVGEVIARALDLGATEVTVALGGSASTDGGAGVLCGLGARLLDAAGTNLPDGGAALLRLARLDLSQLRPRPATVRLLTDVRAPLLGPAGAVAAFAPQKGADAGQRAVLEQALTRWTEALPGPVDLPGAGAAGGTGYGLVAGWSATVVPGAAWICEQAGLPARLASTDLVVSGEGRLDATSHTGKVIGSLLELCGAAGVDVAAVCGQLAAGGDTGLRAVTTATDAAGSTAAATADPARWIAAAAHHLAARIT